MEEQLYLSSEVHDLDAMAHISAVAAYNPPPNICMAEESHTQYMEILRGNAPGPNWYTAQKYEG